MRQQQRQQHAAAAVVSYISVLVQGAQVVSASHWLNSSPVFPNESVAACPSKLIADIGVASVSDQTLSLAAIWANNSLPYTIRTRSPGISMRLESRAAVLTTEALYVAETNEANKAP